MINWNRALTLTISVLCAGILLLTVSCSGNDKKAKDAIQEHLKNQGITDLVLDFFYSDPGKPDKAYASATVTYNFAGADGQPKHEYLGYILAREGGGWRIERGVGYTKDQQKAAIYLAGGK